jgi:hypothetical protein
VESNELNPPKAVQYNQYDDVNSLNIIATTENFIKFITNRITSLCLIKEFLDQRKQEIKNESKEDNYYIDLSNSSDVQKIIYLQELGIIDFLRNKSKVGISNSGLASILSGITGIKQGTLKPSLNRIDKKDIDDSRHPYYTKTTVENVKTNLNNLGF